MASLSRWKPGLGGIGLALLAACSRGNGPTSGAGGRLADAPAPGTQLFTLLPPSVTGVRFEYHL